MSVFFKLIIALLLVVIPLYGINFLVTEIGASKNKEEITKSFQNTVHSYNGIVETEFRRIMDAESKTVVDIVLRNVDIGSGNISDEERVQIMMDIRQKLNDLQTTSTFIRDTKANMPLIDRTISNNNNDFGVDEVDFSALRQKVGPGPFHDLQGRLFISSSYLNLEDPAFSNRSVILAVEVHRYQLKQMLDNMTGYSRGGAILVPLHQNWNVASNDHPRVIEQLKEHFTPLTTLQSGVIHSEYVRLDGQAYLIAYEYSSILDTVLALYVPREEIDGSVRIYRQLFWVMSALSLIIIILFSFWQFRDIHRPLKMLIRSFRKVEAGNLNVSLKHERNDEFGYLYQRFNQMIDHLNVLIYEVYEQKLRSQRSELKRLQSQINPHFLYNNFFVLYRLIRSHDVEKAAQFAQYLGKYFQFITRDAADDILLEYEAQHAATYVELQSVCFAHRVDAVFEKLPERLRDCFVPRLTLQPIIENSYKYAFENKVDGGQLIVRYEFQENGFSIIVEDNGGDLSDSEIERLNESLESAKEGIDESTGLVNVHRRIRLKYGEPFGLRLSRSELGGLKAEASLAVEKSRKAEDGEAAAAAEG